MMKFKVTFVWDEDRWYTKSKELGMTLEHGSFDALVERVRMAAPEMAELNYGNVGEIQLQFDIKRVDKLTVVNNG
jgi:hypothetical protein